ncbi:zinc finger matrin-type protein 5-like [Physella acuta]|uniref:zinc finger matrin-type protein 5-like n=1 Tax=Physella acuta TaxID=109671 RepID=UPI0027DE9E59|nr:zinc finger matrin-type protein 5-like [Physella acuta]XP_059162182.1 zinc finger matrin-type protein 5-like [Physella acuta]XP_059162183.1 zinc finger matrin-type protein 5-like [Physella acuta]XP_059162185.1 zinc finger matrin-type protein 5-like [Physella acuta]XP_059162186.1 zinc finger matrin-type protein 5-like [Physella acuta]XP_059162187.1 zinc finger matrin-type protein 5-like [Physella acuta]
MGRRYYCDYCDKSFADNPTSRKVHLTGNAHLQNRKAHYDAFRDEEEILQDDKTKKPCRAFLSTGDCKFGDRCQFSHLSHEDRNRLAEIVRMKQLGAATGKTNTEDNVKNLLMEWVDKRSKKLKLDNVDNSTGNSADTSKTLRPTDCLVAVPEYTLASCLVAFPSLPPSLLPPSKEEILKCDYVSWG